MPDWTITAANVRRSANAVANTRTCGVVGGLVQGDLVQLDEDDLDANGVGRAKLADANGATVGMAEVDGICVTAAALNQDVIVVRRDPDLVVGATLVPGLGYVLSTTPGKGAPETDLASGWYRTELGYAKSTTVLDFDPRARGVQR